MHTIIRKAVWMLLCSWRGAGRMPHRERRRLRALVAMAHASGKRVRLWASPENEQVWRELLACGIDPINTDQLETLKRFFYHHQPVTVHRPDNL